MYHKFNNFTGRIVGTNNWQPLFPINPIPLSKHEAAEIVYATPTHVAKVEVRTIGTTTAKSAATSASSHAPATHAKPQQFPSTLAENVVRGMKKFQEPNGIPVYLKGGPADKVLFSFTMGVCIVGLGFVGKIIYDLGFVKKE